MPASFTVRWTRVAEADLGAIVDFVAERSPVTAAQVLERIGDRSTTHTRFTVRGRLVPELAEQGIQTYRELVVHPWRIIYRIDGTQVYVLAVVDGPRNIEDVLLDRLTRL